MLQRRKVLQIMQMFRCALLSKRRCLRRILRVAVQPCVLERERGMITQAAEQGDLVDLEGMHRPVGNEEDTYHTGASAERNAENAANALGADSAIRAGVVGKFSIRQVVRGVRRLASQCHHSAESSVQRKDDVEKLRREMPHGDL